VHVPEHQHERHEVGHRRVAAERDDVHAEGDQSVIQDDSAG
jgi:hypothetical protein